MAIEDRQIVQHLRTSGVTTPPVSAITDGEIALSMDNTNPKIFFKKNNGEFAEFVDKQYVDEVSKGHTYDATKDSLAEGVDTTQGNLSTASGIRSHAEGIGTTASGEASHAGGYAVSGKTIISSGEGAVAEGYAEKYNIIASGKGAHAEGCTRYGGRDTIASGEGAHAEGDGAQATEIAAHAEGNSRATRSWAHAEGYKTQANGSASHAEGDGSKAQSYGTHAEGYETEAAGRGSHAEGYYTYVTGQGGHAEGISLKSAVGKRSNLYIRKLTDTERAQINSNYGVDFKYLSKEYGSDPIPDGRHGCTLTYNNQTTIMSLTKYVYVSDTEIDGDAFNVDDDSVLSGLSTAYTTSTNASIVYPNEYGAARGDYSHTEGYDTNAAGFFSHAEGEFTNAIGKGAHVGGLRTVADKDYMTAIGKYNQYNITNSIFTLGVGTAENARKNAHLITTDGKHYIPGVGGYDGTQTSLTEVQDVATAIVPMEEITWSALKAKRDGGTLVPGKEYRITDYTTTTTQSNTRSSGHVFDIIVVADSTSTLNENARAIQHSGDTYFANSNLKAWELKYSLDNDRNKYQWADSGSTGRGVIYYMKDELENECAYDFKNIMFELVKLTSITWNPIVSGNTDFTSAIEELYVGKYVGRWFDLNGAGDVTFGDTKYFYTFSLCTDGESFSVDDSETVVDGSMKINIDNIYRQNVIPEWIPEDTDKSRSLNYIVFKPLTSESDDCYGNIFGKDNFNILLGYSGTRYNTFGNECFNNTFGNSCQNNTFGNDCESNTFGNSCVSNTFGNYCNSNTFGDECSANTFGDGSYGNTFGNSCISNTFENSCDSNTFGNYCGGNTFGNSCGSNTFGNDCNYNTFGNGCYENTFGNNCGSNTFGNNCGSNTFGNNYISWCAFGDGVQYCNISGYTTSNISQLQNITVLNGTKGTSSSLLNLSGLTVNTSYSQTVGKDKDGNYQVKNTLSTATSGSTGLVKLYSGDGNNTDGAVTQESMNKMITVPATESAVTINPNIYYNFETRVSGQDLTITFGAEISGKTKHYIYRLSIGASLATITYTNLPADLVWYSGTAPTFGVDKTYEISILNKLALYMQV